MRIKSMDEFDVAWRSFRHTAQAMLDQGQHVRIAAQMINIDSPAASLDEVLDELRAVAATVHPYPTIADLTDLSPCLTLAKTKRAIRRLGLTVSPLINARNEVSFHIFRDELREALDNENKHP